MFSRSTYFKRSTTYSLLILIISVLFIGLFSVPIHSNGPDPPVHIHLTWQNETNSTITVTWQTNLQTAGDFVVYDTVSHGGVPGDYLYNVTGINYTYTGASGYIHDVELTGLTPDTLYYFLCGGPTGGYSDERSFRTAPNKSLDVRFVVGGDSRSQPVEREQISQAMANFNPAFAMHSGDMVYDGRIQSQWDAWFSDVNSNWLWDTNQTIPIIPAIGNHEYNSINYYSQFALPENEMWYSYNWGPDIHIIVLSTETSTSGAQKTWLEYDLANHSDYKWKFVMFHQPPFPATRDTGHAGALADWVPLFDKYHVDIVFGGHDHAYLRTKPINWTASQTQPQPYANGSLYVVTGGWGAPLYPLKSHWYDASILSEYHFCLLDVFQNGSLHLQAINNQGTTIDEVWIIKNESLPLGVSVEITSPIIETSLPYDLTWNASGIIDHYKIFIDGAYDRYLPSMNKSFLVSGLTEGNHTIIVAAYDPLGNSVNATQEISYDVTPPTTTDDYDGLWHASDFTVILTANDSVSGVDETYYRINDGAINNVSVNGQPQITIESGTNKLEYWSIDLANNEELPHTILTNLKLDKTQPTADAGQNQTIEVGTNFTLQGYNSTDNVAIAIYSWTFIDGVLKTYIGMNISYQFDNLGEFEITLNVSDYAGLSDVDQVWVTVIDSTPPTANAGSNQTIETGTILTLNANNSYDNVGIVNYSWSFVDGSLKTYTGVDFTYQFTNLGDFEITLNVSDNEGLWDTDIVWITVLDSSPPVADAGNNITIIIGNMILFNASGSSDNVGIVNYIWDFGDGTILTTTNPITNYTYSQTGTYNVTLIVVDSVGNTANTTIIVTVEAAPPGIMWEILVFIGLAIFTIFSVALWQKDRLKPTPTSP